jgi:GMP synthase-like glutamine amidotransferase
VTGATRPTVPSSLDIVSHDVYAAGIPHAAFATGPWMVWHLDRFSTPTGATEIARTSLCTHAFRAGRSVGLQFHPEVDAASVARWAEAAGPDYFEAKGFDQGVLLHGIDDKAAASKRNTEQLVDWFLDEVAGA